jgi:hypothetical protein
LTARVSAFGLAQAIGQAAELPHESRFTVSTAMKEQIQVLVIDVVGLALVEAALIRLARRLKNGRTKPRRRWVSRAAGAVLSELLAEGAAEANWQRLRMRAAVDRHLAASSVALAPAGLADIPRQQAPDRSYAEGAST